MPAIVRTGIASAKIINVPAASLARKRPAWRRVEAPASTFLKLHLHDISRHPVCQCSVVDVNSRRSASPVRGASSGADLGVCPKHSVNACVAHERMARSGSEYRARASAVSCPSIASARSMTVWRKSRTSFSVAGVTAPPAVAGNRPVSREGRYSSRLERTTDRNQVAELAPVHRLRGEQIGA